MDSWPHTLDTIPPLPLNRVLSIKVELAGLLGNEGVLKGGGVVGQASGGVPVTIRQVAKRSARIWR